MISTQGVKCSWRWAHLAAISAAAAQEQQLCGTQSAAPASTRGELTLQELHYALPALQSTHCGWDGHLASVTKGVPALPTHSLHCRRIPSLD